MPLADVAEFKPDVLLRNMLGQPFFILCESRIFCAPVHRTSKIAAQNIMEGFSGNQDALRLPSKKKPAQSQVK
jgi:hypothetical protein